MARVLRIISIALITAGIVMLADIGITLVYEEPLTSIYAAVQQGKAAEELDKTEDRFFNGVARRAVARIRNRARRISVLANRFAGQVDTGDAIGRLRAPAMGDLDVVVLQGTDTASLQKGPGHFPETPFPGQGGTVAIAGHRTTYGAPFNEAESMQPGDRISLEMPYATIVYRVQKTEIVDPTDVGVVDYVGYERLVLSTCHPLYSAAQRLIVFARAVRQHLSPRARSS